MMVLCRWLSSELSVDDKTKEEEKVKGEEGEKEEKEEKEEEEKEEEEEEEEEDGK
jgi:peptidyl-prolyl cis-trans isomerase SDCCAG10